MKKKLIIWAAGKINLYLNVLGKYRNGYHKIESIMQSVTLSDKITLRPIKKNIKIISNNSKIPLNEKNLCWRAANLFFKRTKIKEGLEIEIYKTIPSGAGLGGGSADAAATLVGMDKLFQTKVESSDLLKWANELGADIPFCLKGGTALVRGKGEKITPLLSIKDGWIILLYPQIPISTSWAYKKVKVKLTKKKLNIKLINELIEKEGLMGLSPFLYNKLEEVVMEKFPLIKEIKREMLIMGAKGSLMTGSGSTIFTIVENREKAKYILHKLQNRGKVYLVQPTDKSLKEEKVENLRSNNKEG
ncbi:4-(cytidine 5'-diphospho)-2-C-methyl-D-erythritol kinase [Candidatus Aerophobetes bacterium]|nr:4-(cytidine 5'-diphospho)-2-C-methyl-D-erythritol kinase [Candidatus Aerophobetes bacterium]